MHRSNRFRCHREQSRTGAFYPDVGDVGDDREEQTRQDLFRRRTRVRRNGFGDGSRASCTLGALGPGYQLEEWWWKSRARWRASARGRDRALRVVDVGTVGTARVTASTASTAPTAATAATKAPTARGRTRATTRLAGSEDGKSRYGVGKKIRRCGLSAAKQKTNQKPWLIRENLSRKKPKDCQSTSDR